MTTFMKYNPKTWVGRELIRAEGLNHMEQGISANSEAIEEILNTTGSAVSYNPQTLTDEQKAQARANINAISAVESVNIDSITTEDIDNFLQP